MANPTTIDGYIATPSPEQAGRIDTYRRLGHSIVPGAVYVAKSGSSAIAHARGTILFVFS